MTNTDVIKMVAAGLSEQIVITSVRSAKSHKFDLTPTGLIGLKKSGLSDAIITAMMTAADVAPPASTAGVAESGRPTTAPKAEPPASTGGTLPTDSADVPSVVAAEPGLYYIGDNGIVRIEAKTPYHTRTGSTMVSRLTLGIKPARINAMLMGLRSDLQVTTTPRFYMHLDQVLGQTESVGEYYLVRFTVKESRGRREIEIASRNFVKFQAGFPEKDLFQISATRIQKAIYLLTPKSALPGGEYGILQLPQGSSPTPAPKKIFDFGIR